MASLPGDDQGTARSMPDRRATLTGKATLIPGADNDAPSAGPAPLLPLSAVLYYLAASLDVALRLPDGNLALISPQHGVLVALLMVTPFTRWWLTALVLLPAHLAAYWDTGLPLWNVGWHALHNLALAMGSVVAFRLLLGRADPFDGLRSISLYLGITALAVPALSSVLSPHVVLSAVTGQPTAIIWQIESLASALAILTWGSCIYLGLLWAPGGLIRQLQMRHAEALLIVVALIASCYLTVVRDTTQPAPLYVLFIPLLWQAVRFGVGMATVTVTALVTWIAAAGRIPPGMQAHATPQAAVVDLQMFLLVLCATTLIVAVLSAGHRRAAHSPAAARNEPAPQMADAVAAPRERNGVEAQHTEERFARMAMVGQITAAISHEMNQPLGAIRHNAEAGLLLLGEHHCDESEIREILDDICRDNRRASELIRRLRELLQDRELQLDPVHINDVVADVVKLIRTELRRRQIQLETECASLPVLLGDHARLQQVLLNLILNAMDAVDGLPEPRRRILVRTARSDATCIVVEVIDRGGGIDHDKLPNIFDSFVTSRQQGLAVGLAIARSIVEAHGGRIQARNNSDGPGATLSFEIDSLGSKVMMPAPGPTDRYGARLH
jgi:signal transduction histidine kinase